MSILKLLTFASLTALTVTALNGERRCPGNVPSVPLRQVQGAVIVVSLSLNGTGPFDFLVDTGAQVTAIDEQLASQLGVQDEGNVHVSGVATYASKSYTHLAFLEVGGHRVPDVLAVIDNLTELHRADRRIRGIVGENFLMHFDLLVDNDHAALCLDDTGALAAAMKGTRIPLRQPYGPDHGLPLMRPLVIGAHVEGIPDSLLLRLDSGSNAPVIYGQRKQSLQLAGLNAQMLKRFVDGVEQDFAVLSPKNVSIGRQTFRQVTFVQTMNSVGAVQQASDDGVLPTFLFRRVFVSYSNQFAILEPR